MVGILCDASHKCFLCGLLTCGFSERNRKALCRVPYSPVDIESDSVSSYQAPRQFGVDFVSKLMASSTVRKLKVVEAGAIRFSFSFGGYWTI